MKDQGRQAMATSQDERPVGHVMTTGNWRAVVVPSGMLGWIWRLQLGVALLSVLTAAWLACQRWPLSEWMQWGVGSLAALMLLSLVLRARKPPVSFVGSGLLTLSSAGARWQVDSAATGRADGSDGWRGFRWLWLSRHLVGIELQGDAGTGPGVIWLVRGRVGATAWRRLQVVTRVHRSWGEPDGLEGLPP